jgi:formate hydrogenlyase subunit 3/multisubunit Na+/H+ antiporter MnhD subunit
MPVLAFFLILASLGSAAVPGLNGFVGEFPILTGAFFRDRLTAVLATSGMLLGAYYLLWMLQRVIFGPLREPHGGAHVESAGEHGHGTESSVRPIAWHEILGLAPLMAFIVLIGVYPAPIFGTIRTAVAPISTRYEKLDATEAETLLREGTASLESSVPARPFAGSNRPGPAGIPSDVLGVAIPVVTRLDAEGSLVPSHPPGSNTPVASKGRR